jgi:hypothetical protein
MFPTLHVFIVCVGASLCLQREILASLEDHEEPIPA